MIIKLTQGQVTFIDDEDWWLVKEYKWFAHKGRKTAGYYAVTNSRIDGKRTSIKMHRLIMDAKKGEFVDHISHNTLDNHKYNLRICTNQQNCMNRKKPQMKSSSIYKGVSWHKQIGKWTAQIKSQEKGSQHIGLFSTEIEAAVAYNNKAKELFGEYALLNTF